MATPSDGIGPLTDCQRLAQLVRDRRQGITLREAADQSGVSFNTLSRVERGEANPTLTTVRRIMDWIDDA